METDIAVYVRRPEILVARVISHYFTNFGSYFTLPTLYTYYSSKWLLADCVLWFTRVTELVVNFVKVASSVSQRVSIVGLVLFFHWEKVDFQNISSRTCSSGIWPSRFWNASIEITRQRTDESRLLRETRANGNCTTGSTLRLSGLGHFSLWRGATYSYTLFLKHRIHNKVIRVPGERILTEKPWCWSQTEIFAWD